MSGKKMPALEIFTHAIHFLKEHFKQTISNRFENVLATDISYVLTVPAIWNDMAKRFMRQAATEAGIPNDHLTIALEPEAASVWCQGMATEAQRGNDAVGLRISDVGTQYMIVDLGDITVHERRPGNTLLEIHKATGGAWGGTEVDKEFFKLLRDVVGKEEWKTYEKKEVEDMLEMHRDFEIKKRNINVASSGKFIAKIPSSLKDAYEKPGRVISGVKAKFNETLEWKGDKLRVDASLIKRCFECPVNKIIEHIQGILSERKMCKVNKIMLVGGFAESQYVQETFKCRFADKRIINPPECGLAVLKGAVLFGRNPTVVTSRIARYTYGLNIAIPFDSSKHKREKRIVTDAGPLCEDSFWKAVEIGKEVKNGHQVSRVGKLPR